MEIRKKLFLSLLISGVISGINTSGQDGRITWPDGKKAAVCMSYDDGIISHLDNAIPDLNRAGFKGTFYLMGMNLSPDFVERWRIAAAQGHELGCHSLFHPCSGEYDWVPEEYMTDNYTLKRIFDELKVMNQFLYSVDGKTERSYAYPCHVKEVGGINYVDTLSRSDYFVGARNGFSPDPITPGNLNLFDIPSLSITDEVPFEKAVAHVEQAMENGTLAVFCFHGIGAEYIVTSREYHQRIINYLEKNEDQLWVATMAEIASHLKNQQKP